MYKKAKKYDDMIRLVAKFRRDFLKDTHLHLGQLLQQEGNMKQAEVHFVEGGSLPSAIDMYRAHGMWDDALRVVKAHGTSREMSEVAKKYAESLGHEKGSKQLLKLGLVEAAIDFETDQGGFEEAFKLANSHAKHKLKDVHLK